MSGFSGDNLSGGGAAGVRFHLGSLLWVRISHLGARKSEPAIHLYLRVSYQYTGGTLESGPVSALYFRGYPEKVSQCQPFYTTVVMNVVVIGVVVLGMEVRCEVKWEVG